MPVLMPLSPLAAEAGVAEISSLALIRPSLAESMVVASLALWRPFIWMVPARLGALALGIGGFRRVACSSATVGDGRGVGRWRLCG